MRVLGILAVLASSAVALAAPTEQGSRATDLENRGSGTNYPEPKYFRECAPENVNVVVFIALLPLLRVGPDAELLTSGQASHRMYRCPHPADPWGGSGADNEQAQHTLRQEIRR